MLLRRVYLYVVSTAALALLVTGLALLGATLLLFLLDDPTARYNRQSLAIFAAMCLVAAPVYGVHIGFAERFARRDPAERASVLRRLYLYLACLALAVGGMVALGIAVGSLLSPALDGRKLDRVAAAQAAWVAAVLIAGWTAHWLLARRDRSLAGEVGASATLRRWYVYGALLVGLMVLLANSSQLASAVWLKALGQPDFGSVASLAGWTVGGLAVWGFHAWASSRGRMAEDDRRSTLRTLEGFIAVAVTIAVALAGAGEILYYALARALGVTSPGGVRGSIWAALSGPAPQLLIYSAAWWSVRRRLNRDASLGVEAARQSGVRRLYTNLAALVSLAVLAIGLGSLLRTLFEQLEAPLIGVPAPDARDILSAGITLLLVGGAVWAAHWRPFPPPAERQALSRRLYVYAALLGSVLLLLGGGVAMAFAVFRQVFSDHPALRDPSNLDFGRALAVVVVAAVIVVYHWRVLRSDADARAAEEPGAAAGPPPPEHHYRLEVDGVDEAVLRRALAALPAGARYELREVPPAGGGS